MIILPEIKLCLESFLCVMPCSYLDDTYTTWLMLLESLCCTCSFRSTILHNAGSSLWHKFSTRCCGAYAESLVRIRLTSGGRCNRCLQSGTNLALALPRSIEKDLNIRNWLRFFLMNQKLVCVHFKENCTWIPDIKVWLRHFPLSSLYSTSTSSLERLLTNQIMACGTSWHT